MNDISYLQSEKSRIEISEIVKVNVQEYNLPKYLYQYRTFSEWSINNIINNRVSLSNPRKFNDIYDSYLHNSSIIPLSREINELKQLMHDFKYKTTRQFIDDRNRLDSYRSEKMLETFRIACFSTKNNDIKMWGLYANNNQGLCLEYDFHKANNNLQKLFFPIIYKSKPVDVTELCYSNNIIQAMLASIIVKHKSWKYENEWRLIFPLPYGSTIDYLPIENIPKPEKIILGKNYSYKNMSSDLQPLVKDLQDYISSNKIQLYKISQKKHSFSLKMYKVGIEELEI